MKTTLLGIYDRGNLVSERVDFRANVDIDLSFFLILDSHWINQDQIMAANKAGFWFTPRTVKAGEHVVLYTRSGNPSTETRPDSTVYHFLFRELSAPLYAAPNACATLLEVQAWASTDPAPDSILPILGRRSILGN